MKTVAVVGVGLIGGSFALALRRAGYQGKILGVSSGSTITEALRLGVVDADASLEEAAARADLVYLAQPIGRILETIERLSGRLNPEALVTDAGSTKSVIADCARRCLPPGQFLGGHPMAGKELRGVSAAEASLFENRNYFLCSADGPRHSLTGSLEAYLAAFGARIVWLTPQEHDRVVSLTSHLPQLVSTALASCLDRSLDRESARNGAGPGLLDMSRLAQSSYDLWGDILLTNANSIDRALELFVAEVALLRQSLHAQDARDVFGRAGAFSGSIRKPGS